MNGVIESWGLTVNESLEQGTPVIATSTVGASIDLIDDSNGITVSPNSVPELAEAINELLKNRLNEDIVRKSYLKNDVTNMSEQFYKAIFFTRN